MPEGATGLGLLGEVRGECGGVLPVVLAPATATWRCRHDAVLTIVPKPPTSMLR